MSEEEKKTEVKKPVEVKKSSLLESTVNAYLGCETDYIGSISSMSKFDDLRQKTYFASFERASKEPNPKDKHGQLGQLYTQMEQELGYFVGIDANPGRFDDMSYEEQINMYTMLGTKLIEDTINPSSGSGSGGRYKRRR